MYCFDVVCQLPPFGEMTRIVGETTVLQRKSCPLWLALTLVYERDTGSKLPLL